VDPRAGWEAVARRKIPRGYDLMPPLCDYYTTVSKYFYPK